MGFNSSPSLISGGNIKCSSFVMLDTSNDLTVIQSTSNAKIIGISQAGTHNAPGSSTTDTLAAIAGQQIALFGLGDVCLLACGSGWTVGDLLESNAAGLGITVTTDGHNFGAVALEDCETNSLGRVQILIGQRGS